MLLAGNEKWKELTMLDIAWRVNSNKAIKVRKYINMRQPKGFAPPKGPEWISLKEYKRLKANKERVPSLLKRNSEWKKVKGIQRLTAN